MSSVDASEVRPTSLSSNGLSADALPSYCLRHAPVDFWWMSEPACEVYMLWLSMAKLVVLQFDRIA